MSNNDISSNAITDKITSDSEKCCAEHEHHHEDEEHEHNHEHGTCEHNHEHKHGHCEHEHEHDHEHHDHMHGLFHHNHNHFETDNLDDSIRKVLYISIAINLIYVAVEAFCGFKFNSLGLLSDAGHNLSDVFSLGLSLIAALLAGVHTKANFTYGLRKSTILISLINAVILIVAVLGIIYESIQRFSHPEPIQGVMVSYVAAIGILINGLTVYLLNKNRSDDLNVAGAFWHMMADTLVSIGVLVSGIIIYFTNLYIIDTIISLIVAVIIIVSSWDFLCDSLKIAVDGVPSSINLDEVTQKCLKVEGVKSIHHIHIWAVSTRLNALTAHIVVDHKVDGHLVKSKLRKVLAQLGIEHATLELEGANEECTANEACCHS